MGLRTQHQTPRTQKLFVGGDWARDPLPARQEKASFHFHVKFVLKECSDYFCLNFPQASALVFVYYINKYYAANVPIWQGREKSIKMKSWLHLLNTNEGEIYLAW